MAENELKDFKIGQKVKVKSVSYYKPGRDKALKDSKINTIGKVVGFVDNKFINVDNWHFLPKDLEIVIKMDFSKVNDRIEVEEDKKVDNYELFGI